MVWTTQDRLAEARKRPMKAEGTLYGAIKSIADVARGADLDNETLLDRLVKNESLKPETAKRHLALISGFGAVNAGIDQTYEILLLVRSLPQTYAYIDGAKLLVETRRLAEVAFVTERLAKTDHIMDSVRQGLADGAGGLGLWTAYEALGERHATIAETNPAPPDHPYVNQVSLAYTLLTFSYSPLIGLEQVGEDVPKGDALLTWMGVWKIIGSVMGIEEDGLPDTFDEARQLWDLIIASPGYGYSDEGATLLQALKDHVAAGQKAETPIDLIGEHGDKAVLELLKPRKAGS
ncbi:oxygenase MpaB family protein [Actinomadura sp. NTSP31]|uniref:oxygenase MpaB family protein n=1 Tax=Actinomadura sp. NTSP31 TaxID=1735447 RepID=UPI0035C2648A